MKIEKQNNKITIINPQDFDIVQTLNCGQIFRYVIDGNSAVVFSQDKMVKISFEPNKIEIETPDTDYFYHFFDLGTDYGKIKKQLALDPLLSPAINFGGGIRIINNTCFEMLISFIISANNNIKRIKKSIEILCSRFGVNMGEYFAFPTMQALKTATVQDFIDAGLGYRAQQMYDTVQMLTPEYIAQIEAADNKTKMQLLTALKGVGEKVANCIMLFGLGVKNVFPVDVWINKVYNHIFNKHETDRGKITKELTCRYGELSGYAQQYFYYYYRENNIG